MAKSEDKLPRKNEDKLAGMLGTPIKKGQGMQLSTTAKMRNRINAQTHERVNRGYKLREDLIDGCKRLALDQHRKLYEVMEDALSEYLERHKEKPD